MRRRCFPRFYENSGVPVVLSKVSPIEIGAISFGLWVWSRRGMDKRLKRHETIHYRQQVELLFVFQWILYGLFWLFNFVRYRDGSKAYYASPFEREAYAHDEQIGYLATRKPFAWLGYLKD